MTTPLTGRPPLSTQGTRDRRLFELRERERGYTIVPHAVDDLDLRPESYALYVHYRVVSDPAGRVWESLPQLSERLGLSRYRIRRAQRELADADLIALERTTRPDQRLGHAVTVLDVWDDNTDRIEAHDD